MVLNEPITRSLDYPITGIRLPDSASESRREVELEDPVLFTLQRVGERELANREAKEVDAEGRADARHALGLSPEDLGCRGTRPCHAGVSEQRDLDGNRTIHSRGGAERP